MSPISIDRGQLIVERFPKYRPCSNSRFCANSFPLISRSVRSVTRGLYLAISPSPYAPQKRLAQGDYSGGILEPCSPPRSLAGGLTPCFREEAEAQPNDSRVEDYVRTYNRVHQDAARLAPGEGTSHPGTHRADNEESRGHTRIDSSP